MKVKHKRIVEIEADASLLTVTVPFDEVMDPDHDSLWPEGFGVDASNDTVSFTVAIDSGKILNWPGGTYDALWKVRDSGAYAIADARGEVWAKLEDCYVPSFIGWGESGGDYIEMKVGNDGTIEGATAWMTVTRIAESLWNKND